MTKGKAVTKTNVTLTIDKEVMKETKAILASMGLKLSGYTEVLYRALVDSKKKPASDLYEGVAQQLYEAVKPSFRDKKVKK
jgi:antitoxin component of RelBE/YafQ-DinJ toxin-antitoxin module